MSETSADKVTPDQEAEGEHPASLSELLIGISENAGEKTTLQEIAEVLDERSFGAFLLVFSIPNLIPLPPGVTLILGLPLVFVSWQIVAGRSKIWLPRPLANYALDKKALQKIVKRSVPWLIRMEAWVRPRNWPLVNPLSERLFGIYTLFLALIVVIPIPLGNWLPAFAIATIGLAHTEQDGNFLAVGSIIGVIAAMVFALVIFLTTAFFNSVV